MPSYFTGRTARVRAGIRDESLSSHAEAHYATLELRVNRAPHYALLRVQHRAIKQKIQSSLQPTGIKIKLNKGKYKQKNRTCQQ